MGNYAIKAPMDLRSNPEKSEEISTQPPRGVTPKILRDQIRNTAPFIFDENFQFSPTTSPFITTILESKEDLDHFEYFKLCLCAHYTTVATFVPTDVDNQIRFRLWHPTLPTETLRAMARLVLESRHWDFTPVTARYVRSSKNEVVSGHHGEWFSTAVGAYGSLRKRDPEFAAEIAAEILREVQREADIYTDLKRARDGVGILKAATVLAHNLGDLDRVFDMWTIADDDELKKAVYKLGHENAARFSGVFVEAGALNKAYVADENHRHFVLRAPRCLRKSSEFLITLGPFFDDWGSKLARSLEPKEIGEVVEALVAGWEKLQTIGYARALAGILESFPGGFNKLSGYLPARVERTLKAGTLRAQISVSKRKFEDQWAAMALSFVRSGPGARSSAYSRPCN